MIEVLLVFFKLNFNNYFRGSGENVEEEEVKDSQDQKEIQVSLDLLGL